MRWRLGEEEERFYSPFGDNGAYWTQRERWGNEGRGRGRRQLRIGNKRPPILLLDPRARDGTVASYPLVETVHKDNICHVTEAPADVPASVSASARAVAEKAIKSLEGAGIFG